jgi:RNA polymerase sigma factor (TIGR02999 family)
MHMTNAGQAGQPSEAFLESLYEELRSLAAARIAKLPPGQTIQPTALVHEAWMRLGGNESPDWDSRAHFFGAAARAMRNILVDHARRRGSVKRGGDRSRSPLTGLASPDTGDGADVLCLDDVLKKLEQIDPPQYEVVMLRYFAGLSIEQVAATLGISTSTVDRRWAFARAWLQREIEWSRPDG